MTSTAKSKRKSSQEKLLAEAESFMAGCSRTRMELRLVDEVKRLQGRINKTLAYLEDCAEYADEPDISDLTEYLTKDFK